jgi:hypothetical protein
VATCGAEIPPDSVAQSRPGFALQYGYASAIGLVSNTVGIVLLFTNFSLVRGCLRLFFKAMAFFVQHRVEFFDKGQ